MGRRPDDLMTDMPYDHRPDHSDTDLSMMIDAADRRVTWIGGAFSDVLGWAPASTIGRDLADLVETFGGDTIDQLLSNATEHPGYHGVIQARSGAGRSHHLELRSVRTTLRGTTRFHFIRFRDVTVREVDDLSGSGAEAQRRYAALVADSGVGVLVHDGTHVLFANAAAVELLGASEPEAMVGVAISSFVGSEDRAALDEVRRALDTDLGKPQQASLRLRRLAGDIVPVEAMFARVTWNGRPAVQVVVHDTRAEHRGSQASALRRTLEAAVTEAIICTDAGFRIESWNAAATALYGWTADEVLGRRLGQIIGHATPDDDLTAPVDEFFRTGAWEGVVRRRHKDGRTVVVDAVETLLRDHQGDVTGTVSITRPVVRIVDAASVDPLTQLPTRAGLIDSLGEAPPSGSSVVVLLDLDRFTDLNARLGTAAGDAVLVELAARLRQSIRSDDVLVRVGADRFGVHGSVTGAAEASAVAARLELLLVDPFELDDLLISLTSSIGAAWGPNGSVPQRLFDQAERALSEAEAHGGRRTCFFDPTTDDDGWHDDAVFAAELRHAMLAGQITVAYQPIVELSSGRLRKVEALARWTHPVRGPIPPGQFIPRAERAGVIVELDNWVMRQACRDIMIINAEWDDVDVGVNMSAVQLRDPQVADRLSANLRDTGLRPENLWLEVTESVLVDDDAMPSLARIHELGVHLVIDDFGTGYATLQAVGRLPVDALKIDMSFVAGLGIDASDTAIVRSVVNLARELGLQVIAEGVETESQRAQLLALNCRFGQGWLFGRAVPVSELVAMHTSGRLAPDGNPPAPVPVPVPPTEMIRLAALDACKVLDTSAEEAFDSLVRVAAQVLAMPMALITFIDADRQWFKARLGIDATETPRDVAFCAHAIAGTDDVFVVADATDDDRFAANPFVTGPPAVRFYAGATIRSREDLPLGTLCVLDTQPRTLTDGDRTILSELAKQASALLDLRRRANELTELVRSRPIAPQPDGGQQWGTDLAEWTTDLVLVVDREATIRYANAASRTMLGYEPSDWIGRNGLDLIHPDDRSDAVRALEEAVLAPGVHLPHLLRIARADGTWCHIELVSNTLIGVPGVDGLVMNLRDVSERHRANERISRQREFIDTTLDNLTDGVIACDERGVITVFNLAARRLQNLAGRPVPASEWAETYDLYDVDGRRKLALHEIPLFRALQGERVVDVEMVIAPAGRRQRLVRSNGQQLRDADGRVIGAVVALRDITSQREVEALLRHQALHDQLTGLANRHQLLPYLDTVLRDDETRVSAMFVDLDHLKAVNDEHGHTAGDHLLAVLGQRLNGVGGVVGLVARVGGDEFVLVRVDPIRMVDDRVVADAEWLDEVERASSFTTVFDGLELEVTASCGVVRGCPGDSASTLLTRADAAMDVAKQERRGHPVD